MTLTSVLDSLKYNLEINDVDTFISLLSDLENHKYSAKNLNCMVNNNFFREFVGRFTIIKAAGGIVTDRNDNLLFIKRLGKWDLPKGKIEKGETSKEAATREINEECGLADLRITSVLPQSVHIYRSPYLVSDNNWVIKKTRWFEVLHIGNGETTPQKEEGIESVMWVKKEQLGEIIENTYENIKELIAKYFQ